MGLVIPRRTLEVLSRALNPKQAIFDALGDRLDGVKVLFNSVLVAVYIRPEKTRGGILRPDENIAEDIWQGKAGLVVKLGPKAYVDDDYNRFDGQRIEVGEWCAFRINDAQMQMNINDVPCRLVEDANIRLVLDDPNVVF